MPSKRWFGAIEKLKSGRYRARYRVDGRWINAPTTFATQAEVGMFLDSVRTDMVRGAWKAPRGARMTVEEYGQMLDAVTPDMVRDWHAGLLERLEAELAAEDAARDAKERMAAKGARKDRRPRELTKATVRDGAATASRAYRLLHAVFATATHDDLVPIGPGTGLSAQGSARPRHPQESSRYPIDRGPRIARRSAREAPGDLHRPRADQPAVCHRDGWQHPYHLLPSAATSADPSGPIGHPSARPPPHRIDPRCGGGRLTGRAQAPAWSVDDPVRRDLLARDDRSGSTERG